MSNIDCIWLAVGQEDNDTYPLMTFLSREDGEKWIEDNPQEEDCYVYGIKLIKLPVWKS